MKQFLHTHFTVFKNVGFGLLMVCFCMLAFAFADDQNPATSLQVVKCYPNPATSFVNFEFPKNIDKSTTLVVFSFVGKKMTEIPVDKTSNDKITVALTDYYRGVYVYQLRDKGGNIIESGKFSVIK